MDRQQKYRIEDMADDVFGVKDVQNQLRVQREGAQSGRPIGQAIGQAWQSGSRLSGLSSSAARAERAPPPVPPSSSYTRRAGGRQDRQGARD